MRSRAALLVGAFVVALFALPAGGALSAQSSQTYIVQMLDAPAVTYDGGVSGYPATKPGKGKKINPEAANVKRYQAHLNGTHDQAIERVGGADKVYDYSVTFNGFAAVLTEAQAEEMKAAKDVISVTPDRVDLLETSTTPGFLGLSGSTGFWQTTGAVGEDVVIGVLDTGYWPENPAYSDRSSTNPTGRPDGPKDYKKLKGWNGACEAGEQFTKQLCNNKVIGARFYTEGALASGGIPDFEFLSPRDWDGHGSHTSSTAGGENGVQPTGDAAGFSPISGMAPRARLAIYKVCWEIPDQTTASCTSADRVAAIDQSVADGVDVLNHSIGATLTNFLDPVQIAFFNAAAAGVFVAAAAGNAGTVGSVASPGPWTTTVAASTHNRTGLGSVTVDGVKYDGLSYSPAQTGALVDAADSGRAGTTAVQAAQCHAAADNGGVPVLDPADVTGKIVFCERGGNVLVNKSLAVKEAGGIGMVLANVTLANNTLFAIIHSVPAVHIPFTTQAAFDALRADVDAGATASIANFTTDLSVPAPLIAGFSSRGPSQATNSDILKPDISAPGVDILAAVSPAGFNGRDFDSIQGTSMSSPHIAGVGALMKELHPTWSPMMIKSALMTTATDLIGITGSARTFAQGAGHVDAREAADPGLVFDSGPAEWIAFICGTGQLTGPLCAAPPAGFGSIDPSNLNLASISIGDLAGSQAVTRTAKSVGSQSETYTFSVEGLTGITVTPSTPTFAISPNASIPWSVTFTRTAAAALGTFQTGSIKWTGDKGHVVRMPVAIRPVAVAAPAEVTGNAGGISYSVKTGFAPGPLSFEARGLVAGIETDATVAQDPDQTFDPNVATGTFSKSFTVPAGQSLLRTGIDEGFITPSGTDLDVFLFRGTTFVGQAADGDSNEMVTLSNPIAGTYTVFVHGFATNGPSADFTLFEWQVPTTSAGNMNVPGPVATTIGGTVPVNLSFTGLAAGTWYLGQVRYLDGATPVGTTIVNVK
jgi:subtilase family protein/fibronectin type III domain protein/peptidase inhibitor I9/PA domain-containing protein